MIEGGGGGGGGGGSMTSSKSPGKIGLSCPVDNKTLLGEATSLVVELCGIQFFRPAVCCYRNLCNPHSSKVLS